MSRPAYFGYPDRRLFGVYHPPGRRPDHRTAVVLCAPIGQEFIRSHRAFLVLATLLSRAGYPTLRFDYYGTGDSSGDSAAGSITQWTDDVSTAVEEVCGRSGMEQVCLIGLRLGAALSILAAGSRADVHAVVLWDPVIRGVEYLQEIFAAHAQWLQGSFASTKSVPAPPQEALGFPIGAGLQAEIQGVDLLQLPRPPAEKILIGTSSTEQSVLPALAQFRARLAEQGIVPEEISGEGTRVWVKNEADLDEPLVPRLTLQKFTSWVAELSKTAS